MLLESVFDHVLIAVKDKEIQGVMIQPDAEVCWSGGYIACKALAEMASDKVKYRKGITRCPPNLDPEAIRKLDEEKKLKKD